MFMLILFFLKQFCKGSNTLINLQYNECQNLQFYFNILPLNCYNTLTAYLSNHTESATDKYAMYCTGYSNVRDQSEIITVKGKERSHITSGKNYIFLHASHLQSALFFIPPPMIK